MQDLRNGDAGDLPNGTAGDAMTHARRFSLYLIVCLFFVAAICRCALVSVQESDTQQVLERDRSDGVVLRFFSVGPASEFRYQVLIGTCVDHECPVLVRLVGNSGVTDEASLDWSLTTTDLVTGPLDTTFGVGDPLRIPEQLFAWTAGEGDATVSTFAQTVQLTPNLNGLLVHQRGGFEHVKRRHYLFVAQEGRLTRPWTGVEGVGPWWSTVVVVDTDEGNRQDIVFFLGFNYPMGNDYDWLDVTRLTWSVRNNMIVSQPAEGIYAVVFGPFADAGQARETLTENWTYLSAFSVLSSDRFLSLAPGDAVLAAMTTKKPYAVTTLDRTQPCVPTLTGRICEVKPESNDK